MPVRERSVDSFSEQRLVIEPKRQGVEKIGKKLERLHFFRSFYFRRGFAKLFLQDTILYSLESFSRR